MNEKFFDLKKEKQDRMLNGAMKIFAKNGYQRASTDDMVKEAEVSKGLWFHYFGSKLGLYTFVVDYTVKYIVMELAVAVNPDEKDYFQLTNEIIQSKLAVRKQYPYMPLMLDSLLHEKDEEALAEIGGFKQAYLDKINHIYEQTDYTLFREDADLEPLTETMRFVLDGLLQEAYESEAFAEKNYRKATEAFLGMMKSITYQA